MRALFLGRFQPFHLGHMNVMKDIHERYDSVVIAICSAQISHTKRDPFTYKERHDMVESTLNRYNELRV